MPGAKRGGGDTIASGLGRDCRRHVAKHRCTTWSRLEGETKGDWTEAIDFFQDRGVEEEDNDGSEEKEEEIGSMMMLMLMLMLMMMIQ